MAPVKLFARRFGDGKHVPFLTPWWGEAKEDRDSLHLGQFANWAASRPRVYDLVDSPGEADAFVLSISWRDTRSDPEARRFAEAEIASAAQHGRKIIIFFDSDHDDPIPWPAHAAR